MIVIATRSASIDALSQSERDTDPYATPLHWFLPIGLNHLTILSHHQFTALLPPHHLTTSPPHHLTASPPHRLTTSPPHHLTRFYLSTVALTHACLMLPALLAGLWVQPSRRRPAALRGALGEASAHLAVVGALYSISYGGEAIICVRVACTQTPACACAWHVHAHICSALHHGELRLRRRLVPMGACRRASAAPTLTLTLNLSLRPKPEARSPSPSGTLTLTRRAAAAAQCLQRAGAAWHEYHLGARLVFLRPHQRTVPTQVRRHSGNRSLTRRPNLTPAVIQARHAHIVRLRALALAPQMGTS
jgi:hypothetical protein